eukprot:1892782-Alexandrium_andersonii.AAC.1
MVVDIGALEPCDTPKGRRDRCRRADWMGNATGDDTSRRVSRPYQRPFSVGPGWSRSEILTLCLPLGEGSAPPGPPEKHLQRSVLASPLRRQVRYPREQAEQHSTLRSLGRSTGKATFGNALPAASMRVVNTICRGRGGETWVKPHAKARSQD